MQNETQNTQIQNTLFTHDNLYVLHGMNSEIADLIYLDPPFNSKIVYSAPVGSKAAGASFEDMWTWDDINEAYLDKIVDQHEGLVNFINSIGVSHGKAMKAYIIYMTQRLIEMHRILKSTGSIYFHCDPTASHYLKMILDYIFGKKNFKNEIIWSYTNAGGRGKKHFAKKHDVILFYVKSDKCFFDGQNVAIPRSVGKTSRGGLIAFDNDGREYQEIQSNGKRYRYYFDEGKIPEDVWNIQPIAPHTKERVGYPTQKPLALLERIIKASSKEGDLVLDPFCGCATTCVAAQNLGRKWIGIDIEKNAVDILIQRLEGEGSVDENALKFKQKDIDFIHLTKPQQRTDIVIEEITPETKNDIKKRLFKQQEGHCNGCNIEFPIQIFDIDHIIPKAKGGGDYFENYQLLCSSCNKVKGARPMEYLRMKIKVRQEMLDKS